MSTTGTELIERTRAAAEDRAEPRTLMRSGAGTLTGHSDDGMRARPAQRQGLRDRHRMVRVTDDSDRRYGVAHQDAEDLITLTCPAAGRARPGHQRPWPWVATAARLPDLSPLGARVSTLADLGASCAADSNSVIRE